VGAGDACSAVYAQVQELPDIGLYAIAVEPNTNTTCAK